jgi:dTDP-4-amino-4,6-dideoxygalactose transaminase
MPYTCDVSQDLALFGGKRAIQDAFPKFNSFDEREEAAALKVIRSANLSSFLGAPGSNFYGGEEVIRFEEAFSAKFKVSHSISLNSWTSGLWAIMGALDLEPGSEVLVSTWTMAATATTILHWGLIPVFVDIDAATFNVDFNDIVSKTTDKTRAIVSPDIFGLSAENVKLRDWCDRHKIYLVSDSAQSPLATDEFGNLTSTLSHIGGFSLNYHKHIHTGEGGVVVTNSTELAERVRMLRNHGEVAVGHGDDFQKRQRGILGMNLRMGEIEAAIGSVQLTKVEGIVHSRRRAGILLNEGLSNLPGLKTTFIPENYQHSFYVSGFLLDYKDEPLLPSRDVLIAALRAEGVPALMSGYQNIHKLPLFRGQNAIGLDGWPYSLLPESRREKIVNAELSLAEIYHNQTFFGMNMCSHNFVDSEIEQIVFAFQKIWKNLKSFQE